MCFAVMLLHWIGFYLLSLPINDSMVGNVSVLTFTQSFGFFPPNRETLLDSQVPRLGLPVLGYRILQFLQL